MTDYRTAMWPIRPKFKRQADVDDATVLEALITMRQARPEKLSETLFMFGESANLAGRLRVRSEVERKSQDARRLAFCSTLDERPLVSEADARRALEARVIDLELAVASLRAGTAIVKPRRLWWRFWSNK